MRLEVRTELLLDSAGARDICRREGVGTIRLLSTKVLCLQQIWFQVTTRVQTAIAEALEWCGVGPK